MKKHVISFSYENEKQQENAYYGIKKIVKTLSQDSHVKNPMICMFYCPNIMFSVKFYYDSDNDFADPLYEQLTEYRESAEISNHRIF